MRPIMTTKEAADYLDTTPDTVRRWCTDGKLIARKIEGVWAVDRQSVRKQKLRSMYRKIGRI